MPRVTRRWARTWVTSCPLKITFPEVARTKPVMRLMRVLLPEPLGPMMPMACPGRSSKLTSHTARVRPKALLIFSTRRMGSGATLRLLHGHDALELAPLADREGEEPLRQSDGEDQQHHRVDHHPQRPELPQGLGERHQDEGPHH